MKTAAVLLCLAICATLAFATVGNNLRVDTNLGPVQGYSDLLSGVQIFRGIPFAAAPLGENRFRAPQPHAVWTDVKETIAQAQICIQFHVIGQLQLGGEDCLYLDVYIPPGADSNSNLPVMFWIFGGGYSLGDGWEFGWYDGQNLAKKHNVIIVSPNYRLAAMGFLATRELQAEDPNHSTGNFALQDQQMALKWTYDNIAKFGGNPQDITIFGESAGAFSVCWHLVSPGSKGLFKAAIMESGTCDAPQFFRDIEDAYTFSYEYTASIGCNASTLAAADYLACLRKLESGTIMAGALNTHASFTPALWPLMPWGPAIDGSSAGLADVPLNMILRKQWNAVPVLAGTNKDEGSIFVPAFLLLMSGVHFPLQASDMKPAMMHFFSNETLVDEILQVYPDDGSFTSEDDRAASILRDYFFACSNRRFLRAMGESNTPTYLYHFTYKPDWIDMEVLGDAHASELTFVWDNAWPPILHIFSFNDQAMADTFGYYWTNFAKYNNPNGPNNSSSFLYWPAFTAENDLNMILELPTAIQSGLFSGKCAFWDYAQPIIGKSNSLRTLSPEFTESLAYALKGTASVAGHVARHDPYNKKGLYSGVARLMNEYRARKN